MFWPKLAHLGSYFLPIIIAHFDMPILKLAETVLLFYRVTDVQFLSKWTNEPRLLLGIDFALDMNEI